MNFKINKAGRFLVIGRVGMDLTPSPALTSIQSAETMMVAMGGSSANIAAGLVKLGCSAALLTTISDDAVGWYCEGQLDHYGIDRTYVRRTTGEARTSLAVYETRINDHQSVIYRNNAADFLLDQSDVSRVDFSAFDAVITTGTVFAAEPSRSAAIDALAHARNNGLPVIFDVDYRPYSWPSAQEASQVLSQIAALSDVIIGNDDEFGFMAGAYEAGLVQAKALADKSAAIVVFKMGAKGAITFAEGQEFKTGIYPVEALKPTGAGDSFMAGFLAALVEKRPLHEAILRGSACASIVVSNVGCAPAMPTTDLLDAFLLDHPGPTNG